MKAVTTKSVAVYDPDVNATVVSVNTLVDIEIAFAVFVSVLLNGDVVYIV